MDKQLTQKLVAYEEKVKTAVYHPLLQRDLGDVSMDPMTVFFLLLPQMNGEQWTVEQDQAAQAVGAVHLAFASHDAIHQKYAATQEQQLTVLAGDYYSGIHYALLAQLANYQFIGDLSKAIGQVNEVKAHWHEKTPTTSAELIEIFTVISTKCIACYFKQYAFSSYCTLLQTALPLIHLYRLQEGVNPLIITTNWTLDERLVEQAIQQLSSQLEEVLQKRPLQSEIQAVLMSQQLVK